MNGPFSARTPACAGGEIRRAGWYRRGIAAFAALLLAFATLFPAASASLAGSAATDTRSFEQRAADEQSSRSRYRRLEVASLVLILVGGGAITLWAIRRK